MSGVKIKLRLHLEKEENECKTGSAAFDRVLAFGL